MKKLLAVLLVCIAASTVVPLAAAGVSGKARTIRLAATLTPGQMVPRPKGIVAGASGRFVATVSGVKLTWKLTFTHLTGPAIGAHLHGGVKGKVGALFEALCGPCRSGVTGTTVVTAEQVIAMLARKDYVNVHTRKNAAGEIRGQIGPPT